MVGAMLGHVGLLGGEAGKLASEWAKEAVEVCPGILGRLKKRSLASWYQMDSKGHC